MLKCYQKFNIWISRTIDGLKIKSNSLGFIVGFFLLVLWLSVSGLFLVGGVFYGIFYLFGYIFHLIFKIPTPKKAPTNGYEYEKCVAISLEKKGYRNVEVTSKSGDYGADIIATDAIGDRVCIQCKFYSSPVGLSAVQEVVSAKAKYQCQKAAVYTNSHFTRQAKELALVNDVDLFEFYEGVV